MAAAAHSGVYVLLFPALARPLLSKYSFSKVRLWCVACAVACSSILRRAAWWVSTSVALGTAALNLCGGQNRVSQNSSGAWFCIFAVNRNRLVSVACLQGSSGSEQILVQPAGKAVLQWAEVSSDSS